MPTIPYQDGLYRIQRSQSTDGLTGRYGICEFAVRQEVQVPTVLPSHQIASDQGGLFETKSQLPRGLGSMHLHYLETRNDLISLTNEP